jgi:hypothetical protein
MLWAKKTYPPGAHHAADQRQFMKLFRSLGGPEDMAMMMDPMAPNFENMDIFIRVPDHTVLTQIEGYFEVKEADVPRNKLRLLAGRADKLQAF